MFQPKNRRRLKLVSKISWRISCWRSLTPVCRRNLCSHYILALCPFSFVLDMIWYDMIIPCWQHVVQLFPHWMAWNLDHIYLFLSISCLGKHFLFPSRCLVFFFFDEKPRCLVLRIWRIYKTFLYSNDIQNSPIFLYFLFSRVLNLSASKWRIRDQMIESNLGIV